MTVSSFAPGHRIVAYTDAVHRPDVVALWQAAFGYDAPHNSPTLAIGRKCAVDDGLFFVAVADETVVGTLLAGYDGHRGWLYSLAVAPHCRQRGVGTALVRHAEAALAERGCVKINLQIADGNEAVTGFYAALGYAVERRVSMGRIIPANVVKDGE